MKPEEIKPCAGCGKGVMHAGDLMFYRVEVTTECIMPDAVRQLHGLETMMGLSPGGVAVARALSPVTHISQPIEDVRTLWCMQCMVERMHPAVLHES